MPHIGNFPERGFPKPLIVGSTCFKAQLNTYTYSQTYGMLTGHGTDLQSFFATVYLPDKARINKITLLGYRDDDLATMYVRLFKIAKSDCVQTQLANVDATGTPGWSSWYTETITDPVIDLDNFWYQLLLYFDPNDSAMDVRLNAIQLDWQ